MWNEAVGIIERNEWKSCYNWEMEGVKRFSLPRSTESHVNALPRSNDNLKPAGLAKATHSVDLQEVKKKN